MDKIIVDIREENEQILRIFNRHDTVTIEEILNKIAELDDEISNWEDRYNELENDLHDNYRPISSYELYDVNEKDFH